MKTVHVRAMRRQPDDPRDSRRFQIVGEARVLSITVQCGNETETFDSLEWDVELDGNKIN